MYRTFALYEEKKEFNILQGRVPFFEKIESGHNWDFQYRGKEEVFSTPLDGIYQLEVWGSQGGSGFKDGGGNGGYGAYATGKITLRKGQKLYINVGGRGKIANALQTSYPGGYNGGADSLYKVISNTYNGSGGGATSIATKSGLLYTLEENKEAILIVAAGGGGGASNGTNHILGGHAGGVQGGTGGAAPNRDGAYGLGGTQTEGGKNYVYTRDTPGDGSFGKGGLPPLNVGGAGGGAGFYGGGGASVWMGGGGGSSYIGNNLLTEKIMYCYLCIESEEEQEKTIATSFYSDSPIRNYAKLEDGYAKITYLG